MGADGRLRVGVYGLQCPEAEMDDEAFRRRCCRLWNVELEDEDESMYTDSITGQPLKTELVREARRRSTSQRRVSG